MMDLGLSEKVKPLRDEVRRFIRDEVMPMEEEFFNELNMASDRWTHTPRMLEIIEGLKIKARSKNLWNFFLTDSEHNHGLNTVDYAYLAEEMGWSPLAAECFNCNAPDTGNMEVLERYGSDAQKKEWLEPLLDGQIRSAFVMTEPDVASSDATNIQMEAKLDGDEWVMSGEKYFASGAGDSRCKIMIVMVKTNPDAERHLQTSQILVPMDAKGVEVIRPMHVFGNDDAPHGHMHIKFTDVRVPKDNIILGEGRGFEISQGRLGPGRIHHCMRAIGQAERALEFLCKRAVSRTAFGKPLAKLGANYDIIANCRAEIEQARLLTLKTAHMMDVHGAQGAQTWISMIKFVAPIMALKVIDESIQMHGGQGVTKDFPLADMYAGVRTLRLADGPDAVHRMQVARAELKRYWNR